MTDRFYLNDRSPLTEAHVDFCVNDAKGRSIGCVVSRHVGTFTGEKTREFQSHYVNQWLGPVFIARVTATRNGWRYGACQPDSLFRTEAEREAFVAKRIAASRKAAAKKGA